MSALVPAAVVTDKLSKRFGNIVAVNRVSVTIPPGVVVGFLGPNGAGKTTFLRLLSGLLRPDGGTGKVLGLEIASQSSQIRHKLGYMSQRLSLYRELTAQENLTFYGRVYGVSGADLEHAKRHLGHRLQIDAYWHARIEDLPGGIRQRVAFACAAVHAPPLLLLDEPTSGMDPLVRLRFWEALYELAGEGTTLLVSTHFMDDAEHCDYLLLMNEGLVVAAGSPEDLRRGLRRPVVEVQAEPWADALNILKQAYDVSLSGDNMRVILPDGQGPQHVARLLARQTVRVHRVEPAPPSLEDVFVSRLGKGR